MNECWDDLIRIGHHLRHLPVLQTSDINFSATAQGFWLSILDEPLPAKPLDENFCAGPNTCHIGMHHCWLCDWDTSKCHLEWPDKCDQCGKAPEPPPPPWIPEGQLLLDLPEPSYQQQANTLFQYRELKGNRRLAALFRRELLALHTLLII